MPPKKTLQLVVAGDAEYLRARRTTLLATNATLRDLLVPARALEPITEGLLSTPLSRLHLEFVAAPDGVALHCVEGSEGTAGGQREPVTEIETNNAATDANEPEPKSVRPDALDEETAVRLAHSEDIKQIASYLKSGLSVLVFCDKVIVRHLWKPIVRAAGCEPLELKVGADSGEAGIFGQQSFRQRQLGQLRELIKGMRKGQVLVLPYLDLLAGGGEKGLGAEAREVTELLYDFPDRLLLCFADRSLPLAEVIGDRFSARPELLGVPRDIPVEALGLSPLPTNGAGTQHSEAPGINGSGGPTVATEARQLLGDVLVTRSESALFSGYDPRELFKNVAGMNPVRLRHAIAYAVQLARLEGCSETTPAPAKRLYDAIRTFKAQTSEAFEIPKVTMVDIGGYEDVKAVLQKAIELMMGAWQLPDEALRGELIPRGFLLHGPPGTGKTLFAKAVANQLNATIRIVSGPEVTDKYVGESERKVRELFAEARRNAPSVLVFDEFDAIGASRSGRDDGGSRAGNALVAQILTEMDGFRPEVPMLVIATTNRLNLIDEALLRPSRFQAIGIGLPDLRARRQIAGIHASHFKVPVSDEILDLVAAATDRMNGDQIRSIFRDACVGMHCERPPRLPSAWEIGFLAGKLRTAASDERLQRQREPEPASPVRNARPGPSRTMTVLAVRPLAPSGAASARTPEPSVDVSEQHNEEQPQMGSES